MPEKGLTECAVNAPLRLASPGCFHAHLLHQTGERDDDARVRRACCHTALTSSDDCLYGQHYPWTCGSN
jgi:hypothetical protein